MPPKTKNTFMNGPIFEISEISLMEASKLGKCEKSAKKELRTGFFDFVAYG